MVDVRGFDGVYLLLYLGDLGGCLFKRVLVLLLAAEGGLGGYIVLVVSISFSIVELVQVWARIDVLYCTACVKAVR